MEKGDRLEVAPQPLAGLSFALAVATADHVPLVGEGQFPGIFGKQGDERCAGEHGQGLWFVKGAPEIRDLVGEEREHAVVCRPKRHFRAGDRRPKLVCHGGRGIPLVAGPVGGIAGFDGDGQAGARVGDAQFGESDLAVGGFVASRAGIGAAHDEHGDEGVRGQIRGERHFDHLGVGGDVRKEVPEDVAPFDRDQRPAGHR